MKGPLIFRTYSPFRLHTRVNEVKIQILVKTQILDEIQSKNMYGMVYPVWEESYISKK